MYRILEFKQSAWMKPYIDCNTQKRKEATKETDKNLFKLLNNAVYGKTMENMRKRVKIRIKKTPKDFLKYALRPTYISHNVFGKNLVVILEKKELLTLNKPVYVGCAVLELSKLEMYKYRYGFMKDNVNIFELLYSDTDSFIFEIIGEYGGKIIYEITTLKSKMYSIRTVDKNEKSIHKGHNSFIGYDEYEGRYTH